MINSNIILAVVCLSLVVMLIYVYRKSCERKRKLEYVLKKTPKIDVITINLETREVSSDTNFRLFGSKQLKNLSDYLKAVGLTEKEYINIYENAKKSGSFHIDYFIKLGTGKKFFREYAQLGRYKEVTSIVLDITNEVYESKRLQKKVNIDKLTGLYNRNCYEAKIGRLIRSNENAYGIFAFVDLNNFKKYNDTYGHEFGDKVLIEVSKVLKTFIEEDIIVFRISGDEFGIYKHNILTEDDFDIFTNDLKRKLTIKKDIRSIEINLSCSIGISLYNYHSRNIRELFNYADSAMYIAKKSKGDTSVVKLYNGKGILEDVDLISEVEGKGIYLSCDDVKYIHEVANKEYGIPEDVLIESAGISCLKHIDGEDVIVVCGTEKNGEDGLVLARHLDSEGKNVKVYIFGDPKTGSKCFEVNYELLKDRNIKKYNIDRNGDNLRKELQGSESIIIDCLYGLGLTKKVSKDLEVVINIINSYASQLISINIPSGMNCKTGDTYGCCVMAEKTITFKADKLAFKNEASIEYTGEVIVEDIGIPKEILHRIK